MNISSALGNVKTLAEIAAYVSAAWFFLWKLRSGYLIVNAVITVNVERVERDTSTDYLGISAKLSKRGIGSLILHDARARLSFGGTVVELDLVGYERLATRADDQSRARVLFGQQSKSAPFLFLTPEEEATFSAFTEIPRTAACIVEVAVSGKRAGGHRIGQWRSSVVSLPSSATI